MNWRREAAADLGIETVAPENTPAGVPLVIEVSGRPEALLSALDVLAHEGTALVASWYGSKQVPLPLGGSFHRRRLTIRSTQVSTIPMALAGRWSIERRRAASVELLHDLPLRALATHTFPVSEASVAFAALDRGREGLLHAALCYE